MFDMCVLSPSPVAVCMYLQEAALSAYDCLNVLLADSKEQSKCIAFSMSIIYNQGPRWRSWLRHCATSQKVVGSIPDGVIGIFH